MEEPCFPQGQDVFDVLSSVVVLYTVEADPTSASGGDDVALSILLTLSVNPDKRIGGDAFIRENVERLKHTRSTTGMRHDRKPRLTMGDGGGTDQSLVNIGQRPFIKSYFDKPRFYARVFNATLPLCNPFLRQGFGRSRHGVRGQEPVLSRAVITCIGDNVETCGFRQPYQQARIPAKPGGRAFEKRIESGGLDCCKLRCHNMNNVFT